MAVNAISPFEGVLEWVGEPAEGTSRNGVEWKSVDFALKYMDHKMDERVIVFSAFGADRVDKLLGLPIGTMLKITWWPDSYKTKKGIYYAKNNVLQIGVMENSRQANTKITAQNFPEQPPVEQPQQHSGYAPVPPAKDQVEDLPF